MAFINGLMVENTKDGGMRVNNMDLVYFIMKLNRE